MLSDIHSKIDGFKFYICLYHLIETRFFFKNKKNTLTEGRVMIQFYNESFSCCFYRFNLLNFAPQSRLSVCFLLLNLLLFHQSVCSYRPFTLYLQFSLTSNGRCDHSSRSFCEDWGCFHYVIYFPLLLCNLPISIVLTFWCFYVLL